MVDMFCRKFEVNWLNMREDVGLTVKLDASANNK